MELIKDLRSAFETGFIDKDFESLPDYQPNLILNDRKAHTKILNAISRC